MDLVRRLLNLFRRQTTILEPRLSTFERIPFELIQLIANDYLDPVDRAFLILCSYTLLNIIGTSAWETFHDQRLKEIFLRKLEKYSSLDYFCQYCNRLHPVATVPAPWDYETPYMQHNPYSPAKRSYDEKVLIRFTLGSPFRRTDSLFGFMNGNARMFDYCFQFCHLALAMKRHYLGTPHGIPLSKLGYTEVIEHTYTGGPTFMLSVEARIMNGQDGPELGLQIQEWYLVHQKNASFDEVMRKLPDILQICLRGEARHCNIMECFRKKIQETGFRTADLDDDIDDFHCVNCLMDFQLDARDYGDRGRAIVVTRWLDLGAGLDITDPKWLRRGTFNFLLAYHVVRDQGEIRRLFQASAASGLTMEQK